VEDFPQPVRCNCTVCDSTVKACRILHNFVRRNDGFQLEDTSYESGFESIQATVTSGKKARDYFAKYFRHHTELCLGSTIKYDLESDIP
jgi:hypothetical protein